MSGVQSDASSVAKVLESAVDAREWVDGLIAALRGGEDSGDPATGESSNGPLPTSTSRNATLRHQIDQSVSPLVDAAFVERMYGLRGHMEGVDTAAGSLHQKLACKSCNLSPLPNQSQIEFICTDR